jgi:signal transduction histidine kinase
VDDEQFVLTSLKAELKDELGDHYIIETAEGGEEAYQVVQELYAENIDIPVIIADYIMPDLKGDELLRLVHEICPKTLKVMLTGQANAEAVGNAVNTARLYRYISKPWDGNDLKLTVREAIKSYYQEKKLDEQNLELKALNKNLEQKVLERTSELEAALQNLKSAQSKLIQVEKMATLGKLVAGVAHELNNPIGAVSSAADSLERCATKLNLLLQQSQDIEELKQNSVYQRCTTILQESNKTVQSATNRLSALVKNLKRFARLDGAEFEKVNLHQALDNVLMLIRHEWADHIKVEKQYDPVPEIYAFPDQINQALMSLLLFSIQSMPQGGSILLETRAESGPGMQEHVSIKIKDSGEHLSSQELANLFDPNFSSHGSRMTMGLELSHVYFIVTHHRGSIDIGNRPGQGRCVTLHMPVLADEYRSLTT